MQFDQCVFDKAQIIIKAGRVIRKLRGLPEEKNITVLYREAVQELGLEYIKGDTGIVGKSPMLSVLKSGREKFIIPLKDCPKCGEKCSYKLSSICPACKDSEEGKYKSCWKCAKCGYLGDKSEMFFTQRIKDEFPDIAIPDGSKLSLGITTITDDGVK